MADLEITFASVSIPANTSVTLTVEEDPDTDGIFENSAIIGLKDGTTSYSATGFDGAGDVKATIDIDNSDDVSTVELGEPLTITSAVVTAAPTGPISVSVTTPDAGALVLSAPANVQITDSSTEDELTLDWDTVTNATGYYVYRAQSTGTDRNDYTQIADVSSPPYTDTGREDGERYYYRVSAHD